eukprot:scaffold3769_cov37-Tisochrysis_lutea.AAC.5
MHHRRTSRWEMATKRRQRAITQKSGAVDVEKVTCTPSRSEKPISPAHSSTNTMIETVRSFCGWRMVPPNWRSSRRTTMCWNVGPKASSSLAAESSQPECIGGALSPSSGRRSIHREKTRKPEGKSLL